MKEASPKNSPNPIAKEENVEDKTNSKIVEKKHSTWGSRLLAITAITSLLLATSALIGTWYFACKMKNVSAQLAETQSNFAQEKERSQKLNKSINDIEETIKKQQDINTTTETNLNKITLSQQGNTLPSALIQVSQLLRLANINLSWQYDVAGTITLLETANQQIADLGNSSLLPFRQHLQQKLTELKALPALDLEAISLQLTALQTLVPKLTLKPENDTTPDSTSGNKSSTEKQSNTAHWRQVLEESLAKLKNIVVIRRHDEAVKPLITPEQRLYLEQNLILALQQAQWAALHHKQELFQKSIQQAVKWIEMYFNSNTEAAQQLIKQLENLNKTNVNPTLPKLTDLIDELKQIQQQPANTHSIIKTPHKII